MPEAIVAVLLILTGTVDAGAWQCGANCEGTVASLVGAGAIALAFALLAWLAVRIVVPMREIWRLDPDAEDSSGPPRRRPAPGAASEPAYTPARWPS